MKDDISPFRKFCYYAGMMFIGVGIILFFATFLTFMGAMDPMNFEQPSMMPAFIGFIFMFIGAGLRTYGGLGAAGSGIILDPKKAREDLKPYSKQVGGMMRDAMDEYEKETVIKIKCPACGHLNDEDASYCSKCGHKLS